MAAARVLVVDDEPAVLSLVSRMLRRSGFKVFPVPGPREALEILKSDAPIDVVLSDVVMPEMQGPELLGQIAQISPATRCVLMSGYVSDPAALPPGVPLLRKPLSPDELVSTIRAVLADSARAIEELRLACEDSAALRQECEQLRNEVREVRRAAADARRKSRRLGRRNPPRKKP